MIKQEIRSLVRNSLPKIDKTNRFADRYIDAVIEKALASLYHDVFLTNPLSLQNYTKVYYTIGFDYNTTGVTYCTLPESIIPLERKGSGVIRVSAPAQGQLIFFPTDFREMDLIANGSFFNSVNTKVGYAVNQTRMELYNLSMSIKGLRLDLLIPFSKYAEDEEVKIPEITDVIGTNYRQVAQTFMDRVMAILGVVAPVDTKDDNASVMTNAKDN
jgi:hypothetical protein